MSRLFQEPISISQSNSNVEIPSKTLKIVTKIFSAVIFLSALAWGNLWYWDYRASQNLPLSYNYHYSTGDIAFRLLQVGFLIFVAIFGWLRPNKIILIIQIITLLIIIYYASQILPMIGYAG